MCVQRHLRMLGLKVKDRVTGYTGIVATIGFDLYGCVQAIVNPGLDEKGDTRDSRWFDVQRLDVLDPVPVMKRPDFVQGPQAEGRQGAAEKPMQNKP